MLLSLLFPKSYSKTKNEKPKIQKQKRRKPGFTKRIGRKFRLIKTCSEQNTDHTQIIRKIQFRSSFKSFSTESQRLGRILWRILQPFKTDLAIF